MADRVATVNFSQRVHNDTWIPTEFRYWTVLDITPLDLTDVTPKIQIRQGGFNGKLVKTATVGDGITWVNQSEGKFQFGGFVMSWPKAGDYYYDIQFTYGTSGYIRTFVRGKITLIDDSTV